MQLIFFDDGGRNSVLPLTATRPAANLRIGILTIREKWERLLDIPVSSDITASYLSELFPLNKAADNLFINGRLLPDEDIVKKIKELGPNSILTGNDKVMAMRLDEEHLSAYIDAPGKLKKLETQKLKDYRIIEKLWHLFSWNYEEIENDFRLICSGRKSEPLSKTNRVIGDNPVFLEEGAKAECAIFNTTQGPIYLGKDSEVMEQSVIRGPFALCEHAAVKMAAKIYPGTTLGPHCKAGGELNNVIMTGYSNKGHDGFLGNSVIGEWCNIGADTNNSNLKNNYAEVKLWNYAIDKFEATGLQFCGLIMGDHAKCGINTMFNTGTVVGVSANVFGAGFPRNFIPDFSWGGANGMTTFQISKAYEVAEAMMQRRGKELSAKDKAVLSHIFEESSKYRK